MLHALSSKLSDYRVLMEDSLLRPIQNAPQKLTKMC